MRQINRPATLSELRRNKIVSGAGWPWLLAAALLASIAPVSPALGGEPRPIVAVFDIEDRGAGLPAETLSNLTDYLVVLLTAGGYEVVPRKQLKDRISQQKQEGYKACYDQSCQVELGRELAAQKSLSTQIFQVGGVCRLAATLIDLKKATTEKACFVKSECGEKKLLAALEELSQKLTGHESARISRPVTSAPQPRPRPQPQPGRPKNEPARAKSNLLFGRRTETRPGTAKAAQPAKKQKAPQPAVTHRTGQTARVGIYDLSLGFHPGVVFPELGETLGLDTGSAKGEVKMGTGVELDTQIDVKLSGPPSSMYMGGFLLYYYAKDSEDSDVVKYLAAGIIMRMHLTLLPSLEMRISAEMGIGFHLGTSILLAPETEPRVFDGDMGGLFVKPTLELAWYPVRNLGVVFEFGMMFEMTSEMSVDDNSYGFNLPPLLLMSLALEIAG